MKPLLLTVLALVSPYLSLAKSPDQVFVERDAAEALLQSETKMHPEKGDLFYRLDRAFPNRKRYSVAEIIVIRDGPPDTSSADLKPHGPQTGKPPRDAFTREQVQKRFAAEEAIKGEKKLAEHLMARLEQRVPHAEWYTTEQILNAENFPSLEPPSPEEEARMSALGRAEKERRLGVFHAEQGFRSPRIRRDWRDVLYDEDPSQAENMPKALGDLEGATFSYTRDGMTDTDTWSAHAALILPYTRKWLKGTNFSLRRFALAPSVTYDRITTNGDPGVETDTLFYRVGLFMDLYGVNVPESNFAASSKDGAGTGRVQPAFGYGLQLRAAGVYSTDHQHEASLPGFEVDLEPRFHIGGAGLGYRTVLIPKKAPARADSSDKALLEAQLRTWLHMEGGDVQKSAEGWLPVEGSFFRLGPTVEFQLNAPDLAYERSLSLTLLYSYLAAISGPTDHPWYFRGTLSYDLFRNTELNHKIGISASYERGGLNFSKQEVDTFTLGLNVLF